MPNGDRNLFRFVSTRDNLFAAPQKSNIKLEMGKNGEAAEVGYPLKGVHDGAERVSTHGQR